MVKEVERRSTVFMKREHKMQANQLSGDNQRIRQLGRTCWKLEPLLNNDRRRCSLEESKSGISSQGIYAPGNVVKNVVIGP